MTTTINRPIIEIDEELCDGCGQCILGCAEGALAIVDGKARLVGEVLCDGLGACLGECPQGALKLVEREAPPFDEDAVEKRLEELKNAPQQPAQQPMGCGCPGSQAGRIERPAPTGGCPGAAAGAVQKTGAGQAPGTFESALEHWPVKLRLMNPQNPPFPQGSRLLLAADCAPVAHPALHGDLLPGKAVAIACPKFEDPQATLDKLAALFHAAEPSEVTVVRMEVPCCTGLSTIAHKAAELSGKNVAIKDMVLTRDGRLVPAEEHQPMTMRPGGIGPRPM
ncbi:ATP-binding protein [Oceanidesulfovibrio indonesiensis]|jgi:ferredoxin|uniref:ATP-binding protein n=1 Tax=Oceanidesulfovibrio indonesiensis TaxID=54767 RepID=UPI001F244974|nr:4Fe-4S dicluster domain-containing protein [Oceanidesulfovibrio indonesiensis]